MLAQPKRLGLLIYLALAEPAGFQRRDTLLALFWPEFDTESARRALRQSLHFLRSHLGADLLQGRGDDAVGIAPGGLWCDVLAYREALAAGRLAEALELRRGEFLAAFHVRDAAPEFEEWLAEQRARLQQSAVGAARTLAKADEEAGQLVRALHWARRAHELAPTDNGAARAVMRLAHAVDDRHGALEVYETLVRRLRDRGAEPDRETRALAEVIRRDTAELPSPAARGTVAAPPAPPAVPAEVPVPAAAAGTEPSRRRAAWPRAVTALAVALLVALAVWRPWAAARSAAPPPSVAVVPFGNASADTAEAYFAEGIADELTNRLSQVSGLRVLPADAARTASRDGAPMLDVARALGVDYVVAGDLRRAQGRVLVNVRLIEAATGAQRWGESYDRPRDQFFAVQTDVARQVVRALRARLGRDEAARLAAVPTQDSMAHNLYLIGLQQYSHFTAPEMVRANENLRRAVERDPHYLPALYAYGRSFLAMSAGFGQVPPQEAFPRVREMADRILALDPESGEGMLLRGTALAWYDWDWAAAEREYLRGIAAAPSLGEIHVLYALLLQMTGRTDSAIAENERGIALDPLSLRHRTNRIMHRMMARRYDDCLRAAADAFELDPDFAQAFVLRASCLALLGRGAEAAADAQRALQLGRGTSRIQGEAAAALALAGRAREARDLLAALEARARAQWVDPGSIMIGHAALGDRAAAIAWLQRAVAARSRWIMHLAMDPRLDRVRDDPRFREVLRQVGLAGVRGERPARAGA